LEETGHTVDGGTRAETEAVKAAIEESEADEGNGNEEEEKPDLKRKGTMQETVEVSKNAARALNGFQVPVCICCSEHSS